jgi:hypothetical protein
MLENKILNITSEDVLKETNIDTLLEYRRTLLQSINEMKSRLFILKTELETDTSEELKSKYIRTSDARKYNLAFVDVINQQIRVIRGTILKRNTPSKFKAKYYIEYLKTFRNLVKSTIDEDLFETLDNQAKEISGFDKNQE